MGESTAGIKNDEVVDEGPRPYRLHMKVLPGISENSIKQSSAF